jgi:plastocyanin
VTRYREVLVAAADEVLTRAGSEAAVIRISAQEFVACPQTVTVPEGGWVRWLNLDVQSHVVAGMSGLFRSGALAPTESCAFRFLRRGIYHYVCTIQPRMVGTIVVA